ncbi:MAG: hypothetical protein EZS28_012753 [Streblomastix strix]|uniref:Selenium-dependent hydroxylase accessory protein YqeC n=1 Tax=Streblomastix strix TaxID=222440 RepID=A0A5J4WA88_9EUKA|nr:MAG: hypothetical protein EZS28_012753 [Streblomastix strix]
MLNNLFERLQFRNGDVVALVGGGGKTTIMQKLAIYLCVERKMKVIMTTTTNISSEQSLGTKVFNPEMDLDICMKQIQDAFLSNDDNIGHIVTVGKQEGKKLSGINNEWISHLLSICDIIVVEADGASRKPLKACAFYEPVIPDSTSVVISVVGADCVGVELNDNFVHRSQIMKDEILNINSDEPKRIILTNEDVVSVVLSSNGHIKGCLLAQGKINKGSLPEFLTCQGILSSNTPAQAHPSAVPCIVCRYDPPPIDDNILCNDSHLHICIVINKADRNEYQAQKLFELICTTIFKDGNKSENYQPQVDERVIRCLGSSQAIIVASIAAGIGEGKVFAIKCSTE